MSRLAPFETLELTAEQERVAAEIRSGPRGGMRGPFEAWLRAPGLADHAQKLGAYCRFESVLAPDARELAILLTGRHWKAQFEFWAHARLGREAGLPADVIEAVRKGGRPALARDDLQAVYDVVSEYFASNRVSDGLYARAIAVLGERGLVDLVGIVGYYGLVSMTLNVFEVEVPPGEARPFD
jgi:4-carboxymuconolactone decarboxylase